MRFYIKILQKQFLILQNNSVLSTFKYIIQTNLCSKNSV